MATLPLFLDTVNRKLVASATSGTPFTLPPFVRGDALTLRITLLAPKSTIIDPFAVVDIAPLTITAGIGTAGLVADILTMQIDWVRDNAAGTFTGDFPLNTPEIEAAFVASNGAALKRTFEIEIDTGGLKTTALQIPATVIEDVLKEGLLPPSAYTPPSALADNLALLLKDSPTIDVQRDGDDFSFHAVGGGVAGPAGPQGPAGPAGPAGSGGGGGEANTASNIGTGTGLVFASKSGVDLRMRTIAAGAGISVATSGNQVVIAATGGGGGGGAASAGGLGDIQASDGNGGFQSGGASLDTATGTITTDGLAVRRLLATGISQSNGGGMSGNINFQMDGPALVAHPINGDVTLGAQGQAGGEMVAALITNNAGATVNIAFDVGLIFFGTKPTTLADGKRLLLSLTAYDAQTVVAAAALQE